MSPDECACRGCGKPCALGTRMCPEHLEQAQASQFAIQDIAEKLSTPREPKDPYDIAVSRFTARIGASEQMRNLAASLIEGGVRDAVDSFPGLAAVPANVVEQLVSFMAVNVVSSVIQERAHLLARAALLAEVLPKAQAEGILQMIEIELESLEKPGVENM